MSQDERAAIIGRLMLERKEAEESIGLLKAKLQDKTKGLKELAERLSVIQGSEYKWDYRDTTPRDVLKALATAPDWVEVKDIVAEIDRQQEVVARCAAGLAESGIKPN